MRLHNLIPEQTIVEVPMNPSHFAAAVDTGQERGVLVGFEFEVLIPQEFFNGPMPGQEPAGPMTAQKFIESLKEADYFNSRDLDQFSPEEFDTYFKFKKPINGFNSTQQAYDTLLETNLKKSMEIFNKIPEDTRKEYIKKIREHSPRVLQSNDIESQLKFAAVLGSMLYQRNRGKLEKLGSQLRTASLIEWRHVWNFIFKESEDYSYAGERKMYAQFLNLFEFAKTPQESYDDLSIEDYMDNDDYDDYDYDEDYSNASNRLKPLVAGAMGARVTVFNNYHEEDKNMTDWYIEPDGSLSPEDGDTSAEIVSPPLKAVSAIDALKKFFALAHEHKFYTNSSTGLHINVSIPEQLDLLKLAVFLGDEYVLQYFGRLDNTYSDSSARKIDKLVGQDDELIKTKTLGTRPNPIGQPRQVHKIDMNKLDAIAKASTKGHTDSISYNGKYISFRHAGGDYLADYQAIYNTVGRFIRAMIIASTPDLYAQEYKTKVSKLLAKGDDQIKRTSPTDKVIEYLRKTGLPVVQLDIMKISPRKSMTNAVKDALQDVLHTGPGSNITVQAGSQESKDALVSRFQSESRKQTAVDAPLSEFAKIIVMPEKIRDLRDFLALEMKNSIQTFEKNWDTAGFVYTSRTVLPPTDPRTLSFIKKLLQQHFAK
jgi:hypothetical protein